MYDEKIMASSLANNHVTRELLCTLPIEAMNAAAVIDAMNV